MPDHRTVCDMEASTGKTERGGSDHPAEESAHVSSGKDTNHHHTWFLIPAI